MLPVRHQIIACPKSWLIVNRTLKNKLQENLNECYRFPSIKCITKCRLPANKMSNIPFKLQYIARCRYNAVNFLQYPHNTYPIARPSGRGKGFVLWVSSLIHLLLLSLEYCVWYRHQLDRVITALDCMQLLVLPCWRDIHTCTQTCTTVTTDIMFSWLC